MVVIPITLEGNSLGKRHKYLNDLVNEAFKKKIPFDSIRNIPEKSAVDRLFKIDLAAKYRNVDYIIHNLKDEDMLYVSRAMKCTWLVNNEQYVNIVNPKNLEQNIFPDMRTNAINKMKHWIQLKIKNENRSKEFYEYYKKDEIDFAIKFLPKCPKDFFIHEIENVPVKKITPQLLKMLSERSTKAADIYFQNLTKSSDETVEFVSERFITKMQFLLKTDPDTYFYIIENFFMENFKRMNKKTTQHIMKNHRNRFEAKPELYTVRILNIQEMSKHLNSDFSQELIIKLARSEYFIYSLRYQCDEFLFDYKFAKPLLKNIDSTERSKFGTKIFIERKIGEPIDEPPYVIPSRIKNYRNHQNNCTLDKDNEDYDAALNDPPFPFMKLCKGGGGTGFRNPTKLDTLFNEYRFKGFDKTFTEIRKRIPKESNINMRQNMILVLVSKTGGRTESVAALMEYLVEKHSNETINMRAAIVRSLVKRAFAWRWPEHNWNEFLKYGHDLGLYGKPSEVPCIEGQHAIILRHIFNNSECPSVVWENFMNNFTPLHEYKLDFPERCLLRQQLPALLLSTANVQPQNPEKTIKRLNEVCDALDAYKVKFDKFPGIIEAVAEFAPKHVFLAKPLLLKLFKSRIGRKLLFKPNFEIINTDASFVNVLQHDSSLLTEKKFEDLLANIKDLHHGHFLRKLALYFGEEQGLAQRYMEILKNKAIKQPNVQLARPMAILSGGHSISWPTIEQPKNDTQLQKYQQMIRSLQNNSHLTREKLPLQLDSKDLNLTALANWIHTCSLKSIRQKLSSLVLHPRHARLTLALRSASVPTLIAKTFPHAAQSRPMRTLRIALRILRRSPQVFLPQDFEALKSLVSTINLKGLNFKGYCKIVKLNDIPKSFRLEYVVLLYQNLVKLGFGPKRNSKSQPYYKIALPLLMCIKNHIEEIDVNIFKIIMKEFMDEVFTKNAIEQFGKGGMNYRQEGYFDFQHHVTSYMMLIARYFITSKSEEDSINRLQEIYIPLEQRIKELWHTHLANNNSPYRFEYFENFLKSLLCPKVFVNEADYSLDVLNKLCIFADEIAPMQQNVGMNFRIRFIRLFRQAVKLSVKNQPDLFKSGRVEGNEAINSVMFTFGKLASEDVENLVSVYFPSIRMFYANALMMFLFAHNLNSHAKSVSLGLLSNESNINAVVMGMSFYNSSVKEYSKHSNKETELRIEHLIKNAASNEIIFYHEFSEMSYNIGSESMI